MKAKQRLKSDGNDKTFWGKRIIAAEKRGKGNDEDSYLVSYWPTCACGKLGDVPRYVSKKPTDVLLGKLGTQFTAAIHQDLFLSAAITLNHLNLREIEVLNESIRSK